MKHLEQLIQLRSHDNLRTAVLASAFRSFIVVNRHIFAATAGLYLQRIYTVVLNQDTYDGGSTNHAQIPVVFELYGVDLVIVRVTLDEYVDVGLLVQDFRQFAESFLSAFIQTGAS